MAPSLASRLLFHAAAPPALVDDAEITAELYELVALALRAYVSPWWARMTRYDRDLLPHITTIVAHLIRVLHARLRPPLLAPLLLTDLPALLTQHCADYRNAATKLNTAYAAGGAAPLPVLFAALQPHIALAPDGTPDREYYRHLIDRVLALSLPDDDYAPDPERLILREVTLKLLLDDILPKLTQPWFIYSSILDLLPDPAPPKLPPPQSTLIVLALSALQAFSSSCLALINAYKHALRLINAAPPPSPPTPLPPPQSEQPGPPPTPSIYSAPSIRSSTSSTDSPPTALPTASPVEAYYAAGPLLLFSTLISAPTRLASAALFHALAVVAAIFAPALDRLLPALLAAAFDNARILTLLRASKRALFPNGYPGPPPLEPTPEEQAALRARLVAALRPRPLLLDHVLTPVLLGPDPDDTIDQALEVLSDQKCNMRLAVFVLDRLLVAVFPELAGGA